MGSFGCFTPAKLSQFSAAGRVGLSTKVGPKLVLFPLVSRQNNPKVKPSKQRRPAVPFPDPIHELCDGTGPICCSSSFPRSRNMGSYFFFPARVSITWVCRFLVRERSFSFWASLKTTKTKECPPGRRATHPFGHLWQAWDASDASEATAQARLKVKECFAMWMSSSSGLKFCLPRTWHLKGPLNSTATGLDL